MNDKETAINSGLVNTWQQKTVGFIELNRPDKANAYNDALLKDLSSALDKMETNSEVSVLVITGAGDRSFCAGADLNEMKKKDFMDALNLKSAKIFTRLAAFPKVTIAAINGAAVAGGLELALACDIRISVEKARFFFPETKLGLIPAAGGTRRLPQVVGKARAKELILGGRIWLAEDALRFGLLSEIVSGNELLARAQQWGEEIGKRDLLALQLAKKCIDFETPYGIDYGCETIVEALLYQVKNKG